MLLDLKKQRKDIKHQLQNQSSIEYYPADFTWRQLYIKLIFERIQQDLDLTHNFEMIYEFIKVFKSDLTNIKLLAINKTSLKSNNYWLLAIIPKLTSLKHLTLYQGLLYNHNTSEDFWKFAHKAMKYFSENKLSLDSITLADFGIGNKKDYLYSIMKFVPDIKVLNLIRMNLKNQDPKGVGKILSDFKFIKELNIIDCNLDTRDSKEVADGLMRAKALEIIRLNLNLNLDCS